MSGHHWINRVGWLIGPVLAGTLFVVGCGQPTPSRPSVSRSDSEGPTVDPLAAIGDSLRKEPDEAGCRTAVQQVNFAISQSTDSARRPATLSEADRQALTDPAGWALTLEELAAVARSEFDALDAFYLNECLLFREGIKNLRIDNLPVSERATAALAWAGRECGLGGGSPQPSPPAFALRRGWGSLQELIPVQLAALRQAGIDGVLIGFEPEPEKTRVWAIGVPIDGELVLYAAATSRPLVVDGMAMSLRRLRGDAVNLMPKLTDQLGGTEVTADAVKQSKVLLTAPLPALAPRTAFLEAILGDKLHLAAPIRPDRNALTGMAGGADVIIWNPPQRLTPTRILSNFLPVSDGGLDQRALGMRGFAQQIVPQDPLQQIFPQFPVAMIEQLREGFRGPFLSLLIGPKQPRDLILRGQLGEAEEQLMAQREKWADLRRNVDQPEVIRTFEEWRIGVAREMNILNDARSGRVDQDTAMAAVQRLQKLMASNELIQLIVARVAYEIYDGEITYQLAMCKHEQAVRAGRSPRALSLWRSAEGWWGTYLGKTSKNNALNPARRDQAARLRAEARERLNE